MLGVWSLKGRNEFNGTAVLADFNQIAWIDRSVNIVFNSEVMDKPALRQALERLTDILQR